MTLALSSPQPPLPTSWSRPSTLPFREWSFTWKATRAEPGFDFNSNLITACGAWRFDSRRVRLKGCLIFRSLRRGVFSNLKARPLAFALSLSLLCARWAFSCWWQAVVVETTSCSWCAVRKSKVRRASTFKSRCLRASSPEREALD